MTTKEFIEKLTTDEVIAKKMESCKSPEEAYEAAKEAGLTDDIETFKGIMTALNKRIKGELSDDELDNVAGGSSEAAFACTVLAIDAAMLAAVAAS
ncbi:MAG: Nif11-like leader peptide family RiPP precursor [Oscillospiraceae bacterium]